MVSNIRFRLELTPYYKSGPASKPKAGPTDACIQESLLNAVIPLHLYRPPAYSPPGNPTGPCSYPTGLRVGFPWPYSVFKFNFLASWNCMVSSFNISFSSCFGIFRYMSHSWPPHQTLVRYICSCLYYKKLSKKQIFIFE